MSSRTLLRRAAWCSALLALAPIGCSDSRPASTGGGPGDVGSIPGLSLDERALTVEVSPGKAVVRLPLHQTGFVSGGTAAVSILDVSGAEDVVAGHAETRFAGSGGGTDFQLSFQLDVAGLDPSGDRSALAKYVVAYELRANTGRIHGARDLWVALPRAELQLLAPSELPAGASTYARVFARDAATGSPLAGATVELRYTPLDQPSVLLGGGTTDEHGSLVLTLEAPDELSAGELSAHLVSGRLTADLVRPISVTRSQAVLLTTDKPLYQPGQTVHLRALALSRTDRAPAAGREVIFEVRDAKGNKISRQRVTSSDFGIASTTLPLAQLVNFGAWKVKATVDGAEAETTITVDRYSLPKFEVKVTADRPYYHPGDTISGSVQARYFFGRAVQGQAEVSARLHDSAGERELSRTVLPLDAGGAATFELALPGTVGSGSEAPRVTLVAHVRDSASQEVDGTRTLPVSAGDLQVALLPEGPLAAGVSNRFVVAVTDPIGVPQAATVDIVGQGSLTLDASGIGFFELTPEAAELSLQVTARTADGRTASQSFALGAAALEALVVRTDKAVYAAGEVAVIDILAAGAAPSRIAVDVGLAGRAVRTAEVELAGGKGRLSLPIGPELAGALSIEASYAAAGGRLVSDARTVLVDGGGDLQVEVQAPALVAPGDQAALTFQVRDAEGAGVPSAIGVSIVDPAIFALAGGSSGADPTALAFGSRTPAPVAGHAISEVLSGGPGREAAARLLFAAAGGGAAYGIDANTYREELAGVKAVVAPRFTRTVAELRTSLQDDARVGIVTDENAMGFLIARAKGTFDVFGQPLSAEIKDSWTAIVRGRGPDELAGTADDAQVELATWEISGGGRNGGMNGGPGGEMDGDFAAGAGADEGGAPPAPQDPSSEEPAAPGATRVRSWFPETLLVQPSLLTDDDGLATLQVPIADSITDWKIAASASSRTGQLGAGSGDLHVFQDFFVDLSLPPTLTKGDELSVPVAVYNYKESALTVQLTLEQEAWFTLVDGATRSVTVGPGEVAGASFRIRAEGVGRGGLTVSASGGGLADAVRRDLLVEPGGERIEDGKSERLGVGTALTRLTFPAGAIGGGNKLLVRLYAGVMAQTVEGTEAILSEPNGCFEQSTSSTWPDIMVVDYMASTNSGSPEVRERAIGYVQKGYQLLLTFESPQGGFNWFGEDAPGNKLLTSLGLLIFRDMEGILEVDQEVIARNATWLADQQLADGSWAKGDALHMGNEFLSEDEAIVTAFAVQGLAAAGSHDSAVQRGLAYLAGRAQRGIEAPFTLAVVAKTLAEQEHASATAALADLRALGTADAEGRWSWEAPGSASWTGATGANAGVETTAIAAQAFLVSGSHSDAAEGALKYLAANKNAFGIWSQTQATVQSLRAFTMTAGSSRANVTGDVQVLVDGVPAGSIHVTPEDSDIVRIVDLSQYAGTGEHEVALQLLGQGELLYQVSSTHHLPWVGPREGGGLLVDVSHSATDLAVGDTGQVRVQLRNQNSDAVEQVLVKVGLAPGVDPRGSGLDALVAAGTLSRWERSASGVVLYVPNLAPGQLLDIPFEEMPGLAVRGEAPATLAYAYYNPDQKAVSPPVAFDIHE